MDLGQHFSNILSFKRATFHDFAGRICSGLPAKSKFYLKPTTVDIVLKLIKKCCQIRLQVWADFQGPRSRGEGRASAPSNILRIIKSS